MARVNRLRIFPKEGWTINKPHSRLLMLQTTQQWLLEEMMPEQQQSGIRAGRVGRTVWMVEGRKRCHWRSFSASVGLSATWCVCAGYTLGWLGAVGVTSDGEVQVENAVTALVSNGLFIGLLTLLPFSVGRFALFLEVPSLSFFFVCRGMVG